MLTLATIFLYGLGLLFFSFSFWRQLREDYPNEDIFALTLGLLFSGGIGLWVASSWVPGFALWITLVIPVVAGSYLIRKLNLRFFEVIDAIAPAWFWLQFFISIAVFVQNPSATQPVVLLSIVLPAVAILLYGFLFARYRRFSWYPSGRVGFAGLVSLSIYFLLHSLTLVFFSGIRILSIDFFNAIIGFVLAIIFGVVVYLRSGR